MRCGSTPSSSDGSTRIPNDHPLTPRPPQHYLSHSPCGVVLLISAKHQDAVFVNPSYFTARGLP
eukprot:6674251-Pyramimonas_sp.AAC.1